MEIIKRKSLEFRFVDQDTDLRLAPAGGIGNVTISANEFVVGMFLYSLVCDGKIVDTKQMILTN